MPPQPRKGAWQDGSWPGAVATEQDGCSGAPRQLWVLGACCESQPSEDIAFLNCKTQLCSVLLRCMQDTGKLRGMERGKGGKNIGALPSVLVCKAR